MSVAKAATDRVMEEVEAERERQDARWGQQNHPNGTGSAEARTLADEARTACEQAFQQGNGSWRHILMEEVREAFAESDPAALRAELIQVAAVAVAWVEAINRAEVARMSLVEYGEHIENIAVDPMTCAECDGLGSTVQGRTWKSGYREDQYGTCPTCFGHGTVEDPSGDGRL